MNCEYYCCFPCLFVWRVCDECFKGCFMKEEKIKPIENEIKN